ncbi:hypothetical protein MASR1M68_16740 [Elusimicrobiota bacterium]
MKKVLSLVLVLGCVVLFSQIASAAIKGTYTAQVDVSGSFSFVPSLVATSNYTTTVGTITWSDYSGAFASVDNWKNASAAIKIAVTNQKAGVTVQLYQDNANNATGYKNTIGYDLGGGSKSYAGLIRQNSSGAQRFVLGMKVSTTTAVTVAPVPENQTGGFFLKDKSDTGFVADAAYYTILSDQGFLTYMNGTAGGFEPFTSGTLYIHFGANFRDAFAGNYATQTITLESFNE